MNDEDPKPGVVIDVTPDREGADPDEAADAVTAAATEPAAAEVSENPRRGSVLPMAVSVLALVAVAAAAFLGFQQWSKLTNDLAAMDARLREAQSQQQRLSQAVSSASEAMRAQQAMLGEQSGALAKQQAAVDEARADFQRQEQILAQENVNLQEREAELRAAVADVHRRVGRSGTQWMIAEAEYLLRIANDRLILARDTESARIALGLADQRLHDTKDPGWTGVREQIARDITQLSTFEAPDTTGLSVRLSALIEQVPQLKIASATIGPERTLPKRTAHEPGKRDWQTLLDDVWGGFKDSVRIRERDKPVQAMLAPEQQFFLYENLRLYLEAARLALARSDQALFRDNLNNAADWLGMYFDPDNASAAAIATAIPGMVAIDIRPPMPDVSQSLRALQVRQKLMQDVAPSAVQAP